MPERTMLVLAGTLAVSIAGCAFLKGQVDATATLSCVQQSCGTREARDYERCEAACRSRYAR